MAKRPIQSRVKGPQSGTAEDTVPDQANDRRSVSMGSEPSEADIRARAYQKYLERGGDHGRDLEDWMKAEMELKGKG
jgi:hypothetical protein